MELTLILDNIRSTYNVGAILRTAEGFGASEIVFSGYTPRVHDHALLPHLRAKLDKEIHKTALGTEDMLKISFADDVSKKLAELKADGWQIVGLENNISDNRLKKVNSPDLKACLSERVVLILGEEVHGINPELYDLIDVFLEIPMRGQKESFNVSVAAGIAMYAIMSL